MLLDNVKVNTEHEKVDAKQSHTGAYQPSENPHQLITVQHLENFHRKLLADVERLIEQRLNVTSQR